MELRHLRYFVAVAEEENITRAAARLHVSQPPLSRQIRDLENELGMPLLERSAKSVRLTEAGRSFLPEAKAILLRVEEARRTMDRFTQPGAGEIHVGYAPSLMVEILPHALRFLQQTAPAIRVTLHDFSSREMLEGLRQGTLDVALTIRPAQAASLGLIFHAVREYQVCVAVHPEHPLTRQGPVTLEAVAAANPIFYSRKDYPEYHEWVESLFAAQGMTIQPSAEHDSSSSLIAAVESGRGVALVPESFSCFAGARLTLLSPEPALRTFAVGSVIRKGPVRPAVQQLLNAVSRPLPARRL